MRTCHRAYTGKIGHRKCDEKRAVRGVTVINFPKQRQINLLDKDEEENRYLENTALVESAISRNDEKFVCKNSIGIFKRTS